MAWIAWAAPGCPRRFWEVKYPLVPYETFILATAAIFCNKDACVAVYQEVANQSWIGFNQVQAFPNVQNRLKQGVPAAKAIKASSF
jgi:hypothetical protein